MSEPIPKWSEKAVPVRNPIDEIKNVINDQGILSASRIKKLDEEIQKVVEKVTPINPKIDGLEEYLSKIFADFFKNAEVFRGELQKIAAENSQLSEKISAHMRYLDKLLLTFVAFFLLIMCVIIWQKFNLTTKPISGIDSKIVAENENLRKKVNDLAWVNDDLRKKLETTRQKSDAPIKKITNKKLRFDPTKSF